MNYVVLHVILLKETIWLQPILSNANHLVVVGGQLTISQVWLLKTGLRTTIVLTAYYQTSTGRKNGFNDICLKDKSKTNLTSDLSTDQMSQMWDKSVVTFVSKKYETNVIQICHYICPCTKVFKTRQIRGQINSWLLFPVKSQYNLLLIVERYFCLSENSTLLRCLRWRKRKELALNYRSRLRFLNLVFEKKKTFLSIN